MISTLNTHWKDWCWSWSSNTLTTWCEELIHWKRPWCWERLRARGKGADRGWDGWMVSPTQWTWVWASLGSWWWQGSLACCSPWGHEESDMTEWTTTKLYSLVNVNPMYWLSWYHFECLLRICNNPDKIGFIFHALRWGNCGIERLKKLPWTVNKWNS